MPVLAGLIRLLPAEFGLWLGFLGYLEVMGVLFNLLPTPPLDGYGALRPHLEPNLARTLDRAGRWAIWVLFAVLWFVDPVANGFWGLVSHAALALGIPLDLAWEGYRQMVALTHI